MATQQSTSQSDYRFDTATCLNGARTRQHRATPSYVAPAQLNYEPWYTQSPVTGQVLQLNQAGKKALRIGKPMFADLQVVEYASDWQHILSGALQHQLLSEQDILEFISLPQGSVAQVEKSNLLRLSVLNAIEQKAEQYQQETQKAFACHNLPFPKKYIKNCEEVFGCVSLCNIRDNYDDSYNGFKLRLTRDNNLIVISAPVAKLSCSLPLKQAYYQFAQAVSLLGSAIPSDDLLDCATAMSMIAEACEPLTDSDFVAIGDLAQDEDIITWMTEHHPNSAGELDDIFGEGEWGVHIADYAYGQRALKQDFSKQQDSTLSMPEKLAELTQQLTDLAEHCDESESDAVQYLLNLIALLLSLFDFDASGFQSLSDLDLAYNCAMDFGFGFEFDYLDSMNNYLAETGESAVAHIDLSQADYHRSLNNWIVAINVMCAFAEHVERTIESQ